MMSKYGDSDGNLYALDKYLKEQEDAEKNWEYVASQYQDESESVVDNFIKVMDEFHGLKMSISSMLKDHGIADDDKNILDIIKEYGDEDIVEQMNNIDW